MGERSGLTERVDSLLSRAALRGEAAISLVRITFCAVVLTRFLILETSAGLACLNGRFALVVPATLCAITFSAIVVRRFARGEPLARWLPVSVVTDALVCFTALVSNSLFPGDAYRGVLASPDVIATLLVVVGSGFRLSVRLALLGGAAGLLASMGIVVIDHAWSPAPITYRSHEIVMWSIMIGGATALACVFAVRTRALVLAGARTSERLEKTRRSLETVLHTHHDAQSLLTSALINSDRLLRAAGKEAPQLTQLVKDLRADIDVLRGCVREIKEDAEGGVISAMEIQPVPLEVTVDRIAELLKTSLSVAIEVSHIARDTVVEVAGGERGLVRIMHNLMKNAAEGDGASGAAHVSIKTSGAAGEAIVRVEDDGPGLQAGRGVTTKSGGTGVGLAVVREILERSGGRLLLTSGADGTSAVVHLRTFKTNAAP